MPMANFDHIRTLSRQGLVRAASTAAEKDSVISKLEVQFHAALADYREIQVEFNACEARFLASTPAKPPQLSVAERDRWEKACDAMREGAGLIDMQKEYDRAGNRLAEIASTLASHPATSIDELRTKMRVLSVYRADEGMQPPDSAPADDRLAYSIVRDVAFLI